MIKGLYTVGHLLSGIRGCWNIVYPPYIWLKYLEISFANTFYFGRRIGLIFSPARDSDTVERGAQSNR